MRTSYSTNEELQALIAELRKAASDKKAPIWKRIASDLSKPTRQRRVVNLSRIDRYTGDNDIVIVPGKVLSSGELTHKVHVAAFTFSNQAKEKIAKAQGSAVSIAELLQKNPDGKKVKIIG
ncbi:MAG: 50S ribosomal protein L18e [Candidatus Woesearchaeota archaeon]